MHRLAKARVLALLLAVFATLFALTPPRPVQACVAYEIDQCSYPNGVTCRYRECTNTTTCSGVPSGTPTCYYAGTECCH